MLSQDLKEFHAIEDNIVQCYEFMRENNAEQSSFDALQNMLQNIKKTMVRNTLVNITNVIEKVVENGEKTYDGMNKQFNVHSVQISPDESIFLVAREVLGIDEIDKKYVLDSHESYINLNDVIRIF